MKYQRNQNQLMFQTKEESTHSFETLDDILQFEQNVLVPLAQKKRGMRHYMDAIHPLREAILKLVEMPSESWTKEEAFLVRQMAYLYLHWREELYQPKYRLAYYAPFTFYDDLVYQKEAMELVQKQKKLTKK